MARISLVEQYDNKDVIQQIYRLKTATDGWEERISASEQASNEALGKVNGFDERIQAVADAQADVDNKIAGFDARIDVANQTADNAVAKVDTLDRQVDSRIADQEVKGLSVASAGTGAYAVTAVKQNGNVTSNSFNVSKVTSATIGEGSAQNSIYLQLNLSDGTTVRTNDTVISITGVEEDIHVTSIVLEDAPDAHTIKAIFTYNNGQSISSNTLTYDYPDVASSTVPGLVMGNDATGGVQVDGQGRMSVVGWAGIAETYATKTELNTVQGTLQGHKITAEAQLYTLENDMTSVKASLEQHASGISDANDRIDSLEDEIGAVGQAGTIRNEIALLQTKDTELQQSVDGLDARCDNISSTVADHGTMLNSQAEAIQANTTAIAGKQDQLTFDSVPTSGSTNPVTSGGVYEKLIGVVDIDAGFSDWITEPRDIYTYSALLNYSDYPEMVGIFRVPTTAFGNLLVDVVMDPDQPPVYPISAEVDITWSSADQFRYTATVTFSADDYKKIEKVRVNPSRMRLMRSGSFGTEYALHMGLMELECRCSYRSSSTTVYSSSNYKDVFYGSNESNANCFEASWIRSDLVSDTSTGVIVDAEISASSENPVQNKVISAALDMKASTATTDVITQELAGKQDILTAGTGISIENGVISVNLSNANGVSF